jgi:hypothetical protein
MVAPYYLDRSESTINYLKNQVGELARLLEQGVPSAYVRREVGSLLRLLGEFAQPRFNFVRLDEKLARLAALDVKSLEAATDLIRNAPKNEPVVPDIEKRMDNLDGMVEVIKNHHQDWPPIEILLRLELAVEGGFTDQGFQGRFRPRFASSSCAVDTCFSPGGAVRAGGGFFGPRTAFLNRMRLT